MKLAKDGYVEADELQFVVPRAMQFWEWATTRP
jgi:hypothetical protein